jgi:copper(I)-binding protein
MTREMHALSFVIALALSPIAVTDGWSRATPPAAPAAVGFVTIKNNGAADDKLMSASSPWAGRVEIHSMSIENGVMKMREMKDGVLVKAGASVTLAPGALHLMLVDLKRPLTAGAAVPVTLVFAKAGAVNVTLAVGAIDASGPPARAP